MVNYVRLWRNILAQLGFSLYFQLTKDLLLVVLYQTILIFDPFYNGTDKINWFIIYGGVLNHPFLNAMKPKVQVLKVTTNCYRVKKLLNYIFVYNFIIYLLLIKPLNKIINDNLLITKLTTNNNAKLYFKVYNNIIIVA